MGGINSKKGCFGRKIKKLKFFWESEDFANDREAWEIFRETRGKEVKFLGSLRFSGNVSQKFGTIFQRFSGGILFLYGSAQTAFVWAVTPSPLPQYQPNKKNFIHTNFCLISII